jgi:tRNA modification GTPase
MSAENRAILLTPPGAAAIAVVRISGPRIGEFLRAHFTRATRRSRAVHGDLREGEVILDDPIIALSPDGRFADINLHGGPWVVASALDLLRREGFQILPSDPPLPIDMMDGETALEREVAAYLPLARTEEAIRILLAQPGAWKKFAARNPSPQEIEVVRNDRSLHHLLHPPRVAIVGAANVGKSTLANQLFAQTRSITADVPGTTRDWVGEIANIDGLAVMLVDTPGVRETADAIEREAITRSREMVGRADLIVEVVDATAPAVISASSHIVVFNKIDQVRSRGWNADQIATVATTGDGVDRLRWEIRRFFGCEQFDGGRARWWTERQRELLILADLAGVME